MKKFYSIFALLWTATAFAQAPTEAAPTPTLSADSVLSIFSDAYEDTTVDTYRTDWSVGTLTDTMIANNATLRYDNLSYAGIETVGENALDLMAAGMTHLHVDFWSPNSTSFRFKLVDFGEDGFGGGNDTEYEITRTPANNEWVGLDYPLSAFVGMNMNHIAQLIIASAPAGESTVFLDNLYFYIGEEETTEEARPDMPAPMPVHEGDDIISLFSGAYEDVPVNTWRTEWSQSGYREDTIDGDAVKVYPNLGFAGVEMRGDSALDLTGMTMLHIDLWTADLDSFLVKLVDFGMDGPGSDNDTEFELAFRVTAKNEWMRLDIPLADFEMMNMDDISQFIISARPFGTGTVFLDNIYFYNSTTVPTREPVAGVLSAFPNPASDRVTITSPVRMDALIVYDAAGREVASYRPGTEQFILPVNKLRAGVYVARASTKDGQFVVRIRK